MSSEKKPNERNRVLILGNAPLPVENASRNYAPGIRTWHFANSAKNANCDVLVIGYRIPKSYQEKLPEIKFLQIDGIDYYTVEGHVFENKDWLKEKISQFKPDCIVGVNTHPASIAAELNLDIPFWADLNGSVMAEAQAKAFTYDDDIYLDHFFKMESKSLSKADVFSVVSDAQGFSLIGELGIWGRLNKNTMGYRFVRVIPNTAENKEFKHTKKVIRGTLAKESDFVILSSGGFNTWTDVDTLFHGLEKAMAKNPNLVFVSTGGQIEGHDELTYPHFEQLVNSSRYKDRFHLCGWVSNEDLPNYYLEADLGINSDKYCYEAIMGGRTRILDWLRVPLTFISTPLSEITYFLSQNNLAYSFKQGDSDDLAEKLIHISSNPQELEKIKAELNRIFVEEFTSQNIFREFREWIKNPKHAPDYGKVVNLISKEKSNWNLNSTNSVSAIRKTAISSWPIVYSILKQLHLTKYEEQVKSFGEKVVFGKKSMIYRANFLETKIPEMIQSNKYLVPVVVKNIGNTIWKNHKESVNAVNLSYIWKNKEGKIILKTEERTPLPRTIKPGKTIKLDMRVTTPSESGEHVLEIDLLKEKEFWFSEVNSKPYTVPINVKKKTLSSEVPKISIVVVCYNSEQYITKCIDSLLESNYPNFEIITVDNASTDLSLEKLQKYGNKIKLIPSKKNLGFASGNNLGIKNSDGKFIVLINPDAYVTKDSIRELVQPFLIDDKIMITGSKILYPESEKIQSAGGILGKNGLSLHIGYGEKDVQQHDFERPVDYVTGAAMAIRKKLFEITGLFDKIYNPAYYEETEKCVEARKLGYGVIYVPSSKVYHFESTTHGVGSKSYLRLYHTNRFKFIYKNYSLRHILINFFPTELKWFFSVLPTF